MTDNLKVLESADALAVPVRTIDIGGVHYPVFSDFFLEVAKGNVAGHSAHRIYGRNPDIDTNSDPEDIWDLGGLHVQPTAPRIHDIVSTSAQDTGSIIASGTLTSGSSIAAADSSADFVASGVSPGDILISTTSNTHTAINTVSPQSLGLLLPSDGGVFSASDNYIIVTATGTGASVVKVHYLTSDMLEAKEFVVLNGTTPVQTVNSMWRLNNFHVDGAASKATNIGDITATAQVDSTITMQISAGKAHHLSASHTLPRNRRGFITRVYGSLNRQGSTSGAMADLSIWATPYARYGSAGSRIEGYAGISLVGTSRTSDIIPVPLEVPQETDILVRCENVSDSNSDITAGFDMILIDI